MDTTINLKVRALMDMVYLSRVVFDQLKDLLETIDPISGKYTSDIILSRCNSVYEMINEISNDSIITEINTKLNGVNTALDIYNSEYTAHLVKIDSYIKFMYSFLKTSYETIRSNTSTALVISNPSVIKYRLDSIINSIYDIISGEDYSTKVPTPTMLDSHIGQDGTFSIYVKDNQLIIHNIDSIVKFKYITPSSLGLSGSFVIAGSRVVYIDNDFIYVSIMRTLTGSDVIPNIVKITKTTMNAELVNINYSSFINKEILQITEDLENIVYSDPTGVYNLKPSGQLILLASRVSYEYIKFSYKDGIFYTHTVKYNSITTIIVDKNTTQSVYIDTRTLPMNCKSINFYEDKILFIGTDDRVYIGSFSMDSSSKLTISLKNIPVNIVGTVYLIGNNIYNTLPNAMKIALVDDSIVKNIIDSSNHVLPSNFNTWKRLDLVGDDIGYGVEFEIIMKNELDGETDSYRKLSDRGVVLDLVVVRDRPAVMTIDTFNKTIYNIISQNDDVIEIDFIDGINSKFRLKNSSDCRVFINENGSIGDTTIDEIKYKILSHSEVYGD